MALFSIATNFIKRPVLTTVCTIVILLVGAVCIPLLPINYLPDISPTQIQVRSSYTGADVETVENTVTTILERNINGVEGMESMASQTFAGTSSISVLFPTGVDKNISQVNVQNRVAQALPQLPSPVQQLGVSTRASSSSILLILGIYAENGEYDDIFISNYVDLNITDVLKRVPGVGDVSVFGLKQNAMRLWLDPQKLTARQLTMLDVSNALRSQNVVVGAGSIGQEPVPEGQSFELPIRIQGRLESAAEFENLVIKTLPNGTLVRLKDVGYAELGAENYVSNAQVNGQPGVGIAIYQLPGSNALDVGANITAEMETLSQSFPPGLTSSIVYDTTDFIRVSIQEVFITLLQAIGLVILVIFIFLQDWRTTVIPAVAIPVALIGALAFAFAFGFSLNSLTLFGLILATGLVVDDAIVIVEAVTTKISEGMTPKQASVAVMEEISGAVVSTSLVLMAVFIPVAFFPGTTGQLYQQFALIIAFSVVVSTFNALSFSPSMAAILLRSQAEMAADADSGGPLRWFFDKFNQALAWISAQYKAAVAYLIRLRYVVMAVFVAGLVATYYMFMAVPGGFVPSEDQGIVLGTVQGPDGVSVSYTDQVMRFVETSLREIPEVESYFVASGAGLQGSGPNQGLFFAKLTHWDDRTGPGQDVNSILRRLNQRFFQNRQARIVAFNPPPIPGFSATGESELELQDRSGGRLTMDDFLGAAQDILTAANAKPAINGTARTQFTTGTPQLQIDLDRNQLEALDVDFQQALQTIGASVGSQYVNDFTLGTRSYKVFVQAQGDYRNSPDDLENLYVRSRTGQMIPLGQLATISPITGPQIIPHFNGYRSIRLQFREAEGYSSSQAIAAMDAAVKEAAIPGLGSDWIGLAKEQLAAGNLGALVFLFGIIMVFLTLAAQYESYIDPIIILLTVPLAMLGALGFIALRGLNNDVYVQVALVMLIGLASKNAILIVEFANQSRAEGLTLVQSAQRAAEERFRPILMTAISSLVGFFPLVIATGAGSASRWAIGSALFGGLLVATVLSFLIVPVLYVVIKSLAMHFLGSKTPPPPSDDDSAGNGFKGDDGEFIPEAGLVYLEPETGLVYPEPETGPVYPEAEKPVHQPFQEGENPA
ncbi:efflux RND transporter permease subunit [Leptolyngbya sp. KIOST-1]|uniref:efflux RND transporter permease subunit n=1 Tax=Leptolyngbya sp. KIOST-1 TaxID=1229172 RepID=UPI0009DE463E|nr:efflux RND transporter permease subunit [Leptolyngbya sp. KIOST-1]